MMEGIATSAKCFSDANARTKKASGMEYLEHVAR
jgi:hypothetical protein